MKEIFPVETRSWWQHPWLFCVRLDEVAVLQGTPLIGFAFAHYRAGQGLPWSDALAVLAAVLCASVSLVAHIVVLNDWAGIDSDLKDPGRRARTFLSLGVTRRAMWWLAQFFAVSGLVVAAHLGAPALWIAAGMLATSATYSAPPLHLKSAPVAGSLLHLVGGSLHFLLGYLAIAPLDFPSAIFACYFGVVFAAGHLMHEVRGHDADLANGIRTNAVAFGRKVTFISALALFSLAYLLLAVCSAFVQHWGLVCLSAGTYGLHVVKSWHALRSKLELHSMLQLQSQYRFNFAVIGIALLATFTQPSIRGVLSSVADQQPVQQSQGLGDAPGGRVQERFYPRFEKLQFDLVLGGLPLV